MVLEGLGIAEEDHNFRLAKHFLVLLFSTKVYPGLSAIAVSWS